MNSYMVLQDNDTFTGAVGCSIVQTTQQYEEQEMANDDSNFDADISTVANEQDTVDGMVVVHKFTEQSIRFLQNMNDIILALEVAHTKLDGHLGSDSDEDEDMAFILDVRTKACI